MADITIRMSTGGSLDSSSSIISSNVSLVWKSVCEVDLGFSSDALPTLWTTWIFLVWVFNFSNFSVVKEHFLNVINSDQPNGNNSISFHQYADDTQLYIGTNSSTLAHQVALIESCTQRVHDWLLNNGLHLNPTKSEAIAFFNPRSKPLETLAKSITSISVAGSPIKLQSSIKNLGVYLDSKMSFDKQVSEICKASYFHIRALRHIRSSLTTEACKTIATAIVGSRLDYCNSLLVGTSTSNLARLQLVQNTLARVVTQKSRFSHISPVLSDLHWLPSVTELVSNWPLSLSKYCSFISRPTSLPLFHAIHRCDHSDHLPL